MTNYIFKLAMVHFSHLTWCNEQYLAVVLSQIDLVSLKQYGNLQKIMQFYLLILNFNDNKLKTKQNKNNKQKP